MLLSFDANCAVAEGGPPISAAPKVEQALREVRHDTATPDHWKYRALDIVVAAIILIVALPALILIAIAIKLDNPGPIFFAQKRIGRGGETFFCFKFRTMCVDAAQVLRDHLAADPAARAEWELDFKLCNDPRITRLGKVLRRFSIDEFPQLVNVLRGDMSMVGPRPIVAAEIVRYGDHFHDFCAVRPGLTGLWQVSGRSDRCYADRVALDRFYVQRKTVALDTAIILRTVGAVTLARGSY